MNWTCEHCKTVNASYKSSCAKCYRDSRAETDRKDAEAAAKKRRQQEEEDDDRRRRDAAASSSSSIFDSFSPSSGFDFGSSPSCDGGGGGGSDY